MKRAPSDLAALGAPPAFASPLHVGRPNIGDRQAFLEHVAKLLDDRMLSNHGPLEQRFQDRLRRRLGVPHCIPVANGTLGLMLAAKALGLQDEVILPSFTFIGTAHALHWQGLTPVFCDIDRRTLQIDPAAAEALITPKTTAILGVHLFGRTCDVSALEAMARRRGLKLLIDAAHAVGCTIDGRPVGARGDAVVFSFHATKVMNTFEGGAVATADEALARSLSLMSNFGFTDYDKVGSLGINAKLSEPASAMGLASLEGLDGFIAANQRNFDAYRRALEGVPGITCLPMHGTDRSNYHYIIVEVDGGPTGMPRDLLLEILRAENVLARRYFYPGCHRMEPYVSSPRWRNVRLPNTESAAERVLALPTGTAVGEADIDRIGSIIRVAMTHGREIASRLSAVGKSRE